MAQPEIQQRIHQAIVAVEPRLEGKTFSEDTTLADLGLDSLKLIEVGVRLEDAFGDQMRFDEWLEGERAKPQGSAFKVGSLITFIQKGSAP
jgi:acyl carrier protein